MAKTETKTGNTALDAVMSQIRKEFGEMSIMRLGDRESEDVPVISTGAFSLDLALGVGGLPRGRIVECYGQESSGKTTLALHVVANAQKAGGIAAFIDAEHALDPGYAKKIGVDLDNLIVSQPNSGEEALTICEQLVKSGALDVVVVDSDVRYAVGDFLFHFHLSNILIWGKDKTCFSLHRNCLLRFSDSESSFCPNYTLLLLQYCLKWKSQPFEFGRESHSLCFP